MAVGPGGRRTGEIAWMIAVTDSTNTLIESAFGSERSADMSRPWPAVIRSPGFLTTAAGRLVLADRPDLVEDLRAKPLPRLTPYTVNHWGQIARTFTDVQATGVAIEHEQNRLGYSCIAAGIRDADGTLVGAIGVVGRTGTFVAERIDRPVRRAAEELSRLFTGPAEPPPAGRRPS
ncbi:IclR family transcriptional regulator C-terminal domain-containing protein [Dactylosporangium sp. NPDC051541]|uniref:IclR family transcriptional regulator domain-containing protein n=1 Tax=Dactylosporangium sp. NPDC051541 TaxID=3363977 RepID=UPI00379E408B